MLKFTLNILGVLGAIIMILGGILGPVFLFIGLKAKGEKRRRYLKFALAGVFGLLLLVVVWIAQALLLGFN